MERSNKPSLNLENHPCIAGFFLPSSENRNIILPYPQEVLYAGTSPRRMAFISHTFNDCNITNFSVGEEPDQSVEEVAKYKVEEGKKYVKNDVCTAVIAADTQTIVPNIINNETVEVSKGKPKNIADIYASLSSIYKTSQKTGEEPYYRVDSASALFHQSKIGQSHILETDSCKITLDHDSLFHLLHPYGFQKYLEEFKKFYSSNPYQSNGMKTISPQEISGGLSLPVLTKMGAIKSIQGIGFEDENFKKILKKNIHLVAVGISSKLLGTMHLNIQNIVDDWGWLEEVSTEAIKTI